MSTLHILRNLDDRLCRETLDPGAGDAVLLLQDGVLNREAFGCDTAVCRDDLNARRVKSPHRTVSYEEIRELMLSHARVLLW